MSQSTQKTEQDKNYGFGTLAIHAGQEPNPLNGALVPSIELSTTYAQKSPGINLGYEYSRTGNPTREILENLIAKLENGKYGIAFASGSSATASITSILPTGSSILSIDDVYGGTNRYFRHIAEKVNGMNVTMLDLSGSQGGLVLNNYLLNNKSQKPKMLWLESPTNPMLKISDISLLTSIAHKYNIIVVVDNTFATPYNINPLNFGVDIVVHSITKYLNGHSDIVMGCAITNDINLYKKLRFVQNSIGAVPSPFDCFMVIRGCKTLHLRMKKHSDNALIVSKYLEKHNCIKKVYYPFLESHPNYNIAKKYLKTGGGMVTFLLNGGLKESKIFLENLSLFKCAESLGAVESLAEHPAIMTHASVPKNERKKIGILDNLIRLSVGIENIDDIINDLQYALSKIPQNKQNSSKL